MKRSSSSPLLSGLSSKSLSKLSKTKIQSNFYNSIDNLFKYLNQNVANMNNSKIFAGIMIIILNISSKFVTIRLSKTMESYLKYTFSRNILIFAICWMGTRDIYISLFMTITFILFVDYFLNEQSMFCCMPDKFTKYHIELMETMDVSREDYFNAKETIRKYKLQEERNNTSNDETSTKPDKLNSKGESETAKKYNSLSEDDNEENDDDQFSGTFKFPNFIFDNNNTNINDSYDTITTSPGIFST